MIMTSEIIVALIAFAGTMIGSYSGFKLTSYRVEQLEKKVEKHNNFAARLPVVEEKLEELDRRVGEIEHRKGA